MWQTKSKEELYKELSTSEAGLSTEKANEKLLKDGKNIFPKGKKKSLPVVFLSQFKDAIVVILLIATICSLIIGEYVNAIFIGVVVIINAIIGTVQEYNAEKSAEKLQSMIKVNSTVFRDGIKYVVDSEDLVVGDIVFLESGTKVPADIRLIESSDLKLDESILTGESVAVLKNIDVVDKNSKKNFYDNIVYAGTIVISGRAMGVVVGTGLNTELGKIAHSTINMANEASPLVVRINKFSKQLSALFLTMILILSAILYFKGVPINEIFFSVIALTVSAMPEGLSTGMTISLSISSSRMAKKNVICKKLSSVESLGSCSVIASDKTGTLTVNQQTARLISFPWQEEIKITGEGYNNKGKVLYNKNDENLEEKVNLIVKLGVLNNEGQFKKVKKVWVKYGDSIDVAFLALGEKKKINKETLNNVKILSTIPYESENKYSAVCFKEDNKKFITVKGATEKILDFCSKMLTKNGTTQIDKEKILEQTYKLSSDGYRVIALAQGKTTATANLKEEQIKDLTFVGLVSFIDPVRPDAVTAVKECLNAGIKVCMITGDHPNTAFNIGKKLNIATQFEEVVNGEQLDIEYAKGEESFDNFVKNIKIFARVSPLQKLAIVESYKRQGEFVAVTGDGVNDSPALKSANIGVAMGSGTDLAKETGDMIIKDDNFASIVEGVKEGRVAYNNIRNVIYMLLATGFSEVILYVLSIIFNMPFPLLAIQFLWLNFITNGIESNMMPFEKSARNIMNEKQKSTKEQIFNKLFIKETLLASCWIGLMAFGLYAFMYHYLQLDVTLIRTYLLCFMVFAEDLQVFNCRDEYVSTFKTPFKNNYLVVTSVFASIIIQSSLVFIPGVRDVFGLTAIPFTHILILLALAFTIIGVMEIFKIILRRKTKKANK